MKNRITVRQSPSRYYLSAVVAGVEVTKCYMRQIGLVEAIKQFIESDGV